MKVRIAQRGIARDGLVPTSTDDVIAGVRMPWVELDGHRFDDIFSVQFSVSRDDFSTCLLMLEVGGVVELVYVDQDGEPLPGEPEEVAIPENLGHVDHSTMILREDVV